MIKAMGTAALVLVLGCTAALAGCGGTAGEESDGSPPAHRLSSKSFGVHSGEAASRLHLGRRDCRLLGAMLERQVGQRLRTSIEPSPPLSRCGFSGRGVHVSVYLDAGYAARQRYLNRMTEQIQFNAPDPAKIPHPVAGVGDRSFGEHNASWIPAYATLFAVRGNRWLTVAYSVAGPPPARLRAQAAAVARRAFRLTAR